MIYIYSHEPEFAKAIIEALPDRGGEFYQEEARLAGAITRANPEAVVVDLRYEPRPVRLLERIYFEIPSISLIAVGLEARDEGDGHFDRFIIWPAQANEIIQAIDEVRNERRLIESCGLVGRSRQLAAAARVVQQVAASDITVMITGPSGVGKEMIAHALHKLSERPQSPFIAVNVAALAPGIIESELFGHEKGAFTGATSRRTGVFEQASRGTIFLDEVGEIPLEIQAKLLRVLEQRVFTRVGGNTSIKADFRLIVATNRDLSGEVDIGRFRQDLYYRMRVVSIDLPQLSQRKSDIAPLAFHFLKLRGSELGADNLLIEPTTLRLFHKYDWPGNVRELKNVIDSFAVTSQTGRIRAEDFEKYMLERSSSSRLLPVVTHKSPEAAEHQLIFQALMTLSNEITSLRRLIERELELIRGGEPLTTPDVSPDSSVNVEEVERGLIERALSQSDGNRKKAAKMLGIGERTLYRKLEKYGLK